MAPYDTRKEAKIQEISVSWKNRDDRILGWERRYSCDLLA
jgi:hypothetical protein